MELTANQHVLYVRTELLVTTGLAAIAHGDGMDQIVAKVRRKQQTLFPKDNNLTLFFTN